MSINKYPEIYNYISEKIKSGEFKVGENIPTENEFTKIFSVTRNTVRRAIDILASEGILAPSHGKGVIVLENKQLNFLFGGIQSFKEVCEMKGISYETSVPIFEEIIIDETLSKKTGFKIETKVFHVLRIRQIENENVILDENFFDAKILAGLTIDIAKNSIYEFLEKEKKQKIKGSQKFISVDPVTSNEKKYLDLKGNNLIATIKSTSYLKNGNLFEYTESRHRPDKFVFSAYARRSI